MNNNIGKKALIEVQKKSFDQLKNKKYENDEENVLGFEYFDEDEE